jgi:sugar/nucleoside kinase (ribokinase family)
MSGHSTALFLNKQEAYQLTGVAPHHGEADEEAVPHCLHEAGCRHVFITAGADGVQGSDGQQHHRRAAYKTHAVSTVGAGDAFAAGALTALIKGCDLERALRLGSLNAASLVQGYGATEGLLTWEEANAWDEQCKPGGRCPARPAAAVEEEGN